MKAVRASRCRWTFFFFGDDFSAGIPQVGNVVLDCLHQPRETLCRRGWALADDRIPAETSGWHSEIPQSPSYPDFSPCMLNKISFMWNLHYSSPGTELARLHRRGTYITIFSSFPYPRSVPKLSPARLTCHCLRTTSPYAPWVTSFTFQLYFSIVCHLLLKIALLSLRCRRVPVQRGNIYGLSAQGCRSPEHASNSPHKPFHLPGRGLTNQGKPTWVPRANEACNIPGISLTFIISFPSAKPNTAGHREGRKKSLLSGYIPVVIFAELLLWRATASRAVLKSDCKVETTFIFPPSEPPDELPALLCVFIFLYILFFFFFLHKTNCN